MGNTADMAARLYRLAGWPCSRARQEAIAGLIRRISANEIDPLMLSPGLEERLLARVVHPASRSAIFEYFKRVQVSESFPLFDAFAGLRRRVLKLDLLSPTPVSRLPALERSLATRARLFVKRDDLTSPLYGGNKVRKLEFTLAAALASGSRLLITGGGLGSHMSVALAAFGQAHGLRSEAVLLRQSVDEHVRKNLRLAKYFGMSLRRADHPGSLAGKLLAAWVRARVRAWDAGEAPPTLVLPGDSNALSCLGYANAAFELRNQIEAGDAPAPDYVFVALGSGGTLAGLLAGFRLAGLGGKLIGVRVTSRLAANRQRVLRLANEVVALLAKRTFAPLRGVRAEPHHVRVMHGYCGKGYGYPTQEAERAAHLAKRSEGLLLDHTYTGKAMAALIDFAGSEQARGANIMFVNTVSSVDLSTQAAAVAAHQLEEPLRVFLSGS